MDDENDRDARSPLDVVFNPYIVRASEAYGQRIADSSSLPKPTAQSTASDICAWKDIVDEVFLIKALPHLPFPTPDNLAERRAGVINRILTHGFAKDEVEANKLYKNLARYAHVSLEQVRDDPQLEAMLKRPFQVEIDSRGVVRERGARGRWQAVRSRVEHQVAEELGDMRRDWVARLADPQSDPLLHQFYNRSLARWELGCNEFQEVQRASEFYPCSMEELLAYGDALLARGPHPLPPMFRWPDDDVNRHAEVARTVDGIDLREPIIYSVLLQRLRAELKPLVWEEAILFSQRNHTEVDFAGFEDAVPGKFYDHVLPTVNRMRPIIEHYLAPETIQDFAQDLQKLLCAHSDATLYYLRDTANRRASGLSL